jgi:uncharacterized protein (TIGR03437 family)
VIVPYEVSGSATNVVVLVNGFTVAPAGSYGIVPSSPGIFSGAILNQDGSVNSAANPATRGSTIQIYATGEGAVSPPGVTGEVTGWDTKTPVLPVTVTINAVQAQVTYAGSAPDAIAGLFQVNAIVPSTVPPGSAVPIQLTVGNAPSQRNLTIAVK